MLTILGHTDIASSGTNSITVPAETQLVLALAGGWSTPASPTFNGVAMTEITAAAASVTGDNNTARTKIFTGVFSPGTYTVVSTQVVCFVFLRLVASTTPTDTDTSGTSKSTSQSKTLTTSADKDMVFVVGYCESNVTTNITSSGTTIFKSGVKYISAYVAADASSEALSVTGSDSWVCGSWVTISGLTGGQVIIWSE